MPGVGKTGRVALGACPPPPPVPHITLPLPARRLFRISVCCPSCQLIFLSLMQLLRWGEVLLGVADLHHREASIRKSEKSERPTPKATAQSHGPKPQSPTYSKSARTQKYSGRKYCKRTYRPNAQNIRSAFVRAPRIGRAERDYLKKYGNLHNGWVPFGRPLKQPTNGICTL